MGNRGAPTFATRRTVAEKSPILRSTEVRRLPLPNGADRKVVMRRRVVITGMGAITPIGNDVESMWSVLRAGGSGIGRITHFDASRFPTKIAAEVKNFDLSSYVVDPGRYAYSGRNVTFAIAAAT